MSAPPIGMIISTPKSKRDPHHHREQLPRAGMQHEVAGSSHRDGEQQQVDEVLAFVGDRALRQDLLQFPRRHQAAGEGQRAEDDLDGEHRHREAGDVGASQIEFGGADQRDAERAEGVAERRPLRHGGHLHQAQRNADDGAEHQRDRDPLVVDDAVVQQRAADGQQHADLAGPDAVPGRARRTHPLQRENEQDAGDQVGDFDDGLGDGQSVHGLVGRLLLNILSMRSVIRKPPTMLLVAAMIAIMPST